MLVNEIKYAKKKFPFAVGVPSAATIYSIGQTEMETGVYRLGETGITVVVETTPKRAVQKLHKLAQKESGEENPTFMRDDQFFNAEFISDQLQQDRESWQYTPHS